MGTIHTVDQSKILKEKHLVIELLAGLAAFLAFTGKNIKPAVVIHIGVF